MYLPHHSSAEIKLWVIMVGILEAHKATCKEEREEHQEYGHGEDDEEESPIQVHPWNYIPTQCSGKGVVISGNVPTVTQITD